jgi:hypothetical protein
MNDAFANEGYKSVNDLFEKIDCCWFGDIGVITDVFLKVTIAEFLNNVVVVGTLHHLKYSYYVARTHLLQNLDLLQKGGFEIFVRED